MIPWLKKQADVLSSIAILLGAASGIIVFFGGSIPPWYTPAQAQEDGQKAAKIQSDTVATLEKLNSKIDRVTKQIDQDDCNGFSVTLLQAQSALVKNPSDVMARGLRDNILGQMRQIQGCAP